MYKTIALFSLIVISFNAHGARWGLQVGIIFGTFDYSEAGGYSNPSFGFIHPYEFRYVDLGFDTINAGTSAYVSFGNSITPSTNMDLYFSRQLSDAGGVLFLEPESDYYDSGSGLALDQFSDRELQDSYVHAPEFPTPAHNPGQLAYNESGQVVGINKLLVNGVYYNVTFQNGSYTEILGDSDPTFLGDKAGAQDAATEIKRVLESSGFQFSNGSITGCDTSNCSILSPYLYDEEMYSGPAAGFQARETSIGSSSIRVLQNRREGTNYDPRGVLAVYQVTEVPLPAAAWLFLSALGGLGFLKRRNSFDKDTVNA